MTDREETRRDAEQYADTKTPGKIALLAADYLAVLAELEQAEQRLARAEEQRDAAMVNASDEVARRQWAERARDAWRERALKAEGGERGS